MMSEAVPHHVAHLRRVLALALAAIFAMAAPIVVGDPPDALRVEQGRWLLWVFVAIAILDLMTVMPAYRAMLAGPRRVFAVNGNERELLRAHRLAHVVATARVAAVAVLGLMAFFITGEREWFWMFGAVAVIGMGILWPLRKQVETLLAGDAPQSP